MAEDTGRVTNQLHDLDIAEVGAKDAIAAYTSFLRVLAKLYRLDLEYPLEGGWPTVTPGWIDFCGFGPKATDFILHIPKLDGGDGTPMLKDTNFRCPIPDEANKDLWKECAAQTATGEERELILADEALDWEEIPPGWILISNGERYRYEVWLDIDSDAVLWWPRGDMPYGEGSYTGDLEPWDPDADQSPPNEWKCMRRFRIKTFFDMLVEQFTVMNFMPVLEGGGIHEVEPWGEPDEREKKRMQIMVDAGWPGDDFDAEKAEAAMVEWHLSGYKVDQ